MPSDLIEPLRGDWKDWLVGLTPPEGVDAPGRYVTLRHLYALFKLNPGDIIPPGLVEPPPCPLDSQE